MIISPQKAKTNLIQRMSNVDQRVLRPLKYAAADLVELNPAGTELSLQNLLTYADENHPSATKYSINETIDRLSLNREHILSAIGVELRRAGWNVSVTRGGFGAGASSYPILVVSNPLFESEDEALSEATATAQTDLATLHEKLMSQQDVDPDPDPADGSD